MGKKTIAISLIVIFCLGVFYILDLLTRKEMIINKDEVGLVYNRIFESNYKLINQGTHSLGLFEEVVIYSIERQKIKERLETIYKEDEISNLNVIMYFKVKRDSVPILHEIFGTKYKNNFLIPELRSSIRNYTKDFKKDSILFENMESKLIKILMTEPYVSRLFEIHDIIIYDNNQHKIRI